MDGSADRGWLDWWANPTTRLGSVEVQLSVPSTANGSGPRARLVAKDPGTIEEFELLRLLDPVFNLRLSNGTSILVRAEPTADRGEVTLHEYDGPDYSASANRLDI